MIKPEPIKEEVNVTSKEYPVEEVKEVVKNKDFVTPYTDLNKLDVDNVIPSIILPVTSYNRLKEIEEHYDNVTKDNDGDINKILSKDELTPVLVMIQGRNYATLDDVYHSAVNNPEVKDYTNNIMYGDKELNIRNINFNQLQVLLVELRLLLDLHH